MRGRLTVVLVLIALAGAACGGGHSGHTSSGASTGAKTVTIEMRDIAYSPDAVTVKRGETVRFVFANRGTAPHDAFIGDEAAQAAHEKEMGTAMSGMDHGHGQTTGITVQPGKTGQLEHAFQAAGTTLIGCHQPGHYAAGMKVTVTVV
jgi:uncharacterized cupredoxin-like copper-binding protein